MREKTMTGETLASNFRLIGSVPVIFISMGGGDFLIATPYLFQTSRHGLLQCWKKSGSTRKFLTKYFCWKSSYTLQKIFVILYTGMPYNLLIV